MTEGQAAGLMVAIAAEQNIACQELSKEDIFLRFQDSDAILK